MWPASKGWCGCATTDWRRSKKASRPSQRSCGSPARPSSSLVLQLLVPVRTPLRGQVEHIPERFEAAHVARFLSGLRRRVEQLRAPEVADRVAVAVEDVEHRPLLAVR